jgi:MFS family permease
MTARGETAQVPQGARDVSRGLVAVVGFLVCVEVASGILQGFYTPIWTEVAGRLDIRVADVNWFEAAQLIVSALVVPFLARLGDVIGHKNVLLISTGVTALGSWTLAFAPSFTTFLLGYAIQGAYVIWLPLEVAIIYRRTAGSPRQAGLTRRSAGILVGALEAAVIVAALASGALVGILPLTLVLALPAVAVTICLVVVFFGIERQPGRAGSGFDLGGLGLLTLSLGLVMAGLITLHLLGPGQIVPWSLMVVGVFAFVPFVRYERRQAEPIIDVGLLAQRRQWPIQLTAFLIGMSVLGAQIPLSTFARADPDVVGYGLGAGPGFVSVLIGVYVIFLAAGALTLPLLTKLLGVRGSLMASALVVAVGYALWLPFHSSTGEALVNSIVVGLGTGALIAALPATAAASAPDDRTGFATGMTNAAKTVGGAIASSVFAIALASTGTIADPASGRAPLAGYLVVWTICSLAAVAAAVALGALPRRQTSKTATALR